MHVKRATFTLT